MTKTTEEIVWATRKIGKLSLAQQLEMGLAKEPIRKHNNKYVIGEAVPPSTRRRDRCAVITKRSPFGRVLRAVYKPNPTDEDHPGYLTIHRATKPAIVRRASLELLDQMREGV